MASLVVIGMQWGDEGKGKIVDLLCPAFDGVVRFQGGNNAGHTVKFGDRHFALHLVPSGIVRPAMRCVLGNGMVIDPEALFSELDRLAEAGVDAAGRLFVSRRAHVLLPFHVALDRARESARGEGAIGTTARGIGPAYESKASRSGVRMADLVSDDLEARLEAAAAPAEIQLRGLGAEAIDRPELVARCRAWAERLAPMLCDADYLLNDWLDQGEGLLFEGAQGTLLDLDFGSYPYVTSSSASVAGASTGSGVAPRRIDGSLGVIKAYSTRVGGGPFPSELEDDTGEYLRRRGNEVGTTTGRPRRCGWLDAVAARHSRMINGIDTLAVTKLDVLDRLDEVRICVGYRIGERIERRLPATAAELARAEPVYRTVPGWRQETAGTLERSALPEAARDYLDLMEEEVGAPISLVSTGPRREETLIEATAELERLTGGGVSKLLAGRGV